MIIPLDSGTDSFDHCSLHPHGPVGASTAALRARLRQFQRDKHRGGATVAAQRCRIPDGDEKRDRFRDSLTADTTYAIVPEASRAAPHRLAMSRDRRLLSQATKTACQRFQALPERFRLFDQELKRILNPLSA